jgi:ankyrin repeat protein
MISNFKKMLLENGAQLSHKDSHGFNALMYACLYERSNIAELILNAPGGDFNLLDKDNYGNTAFHLASLSRNDKLCFILAKLAQKFGINKY